MAPAIKRFSIFYCSGSRALTVVPCQALTDARGQQEHLGEEWRKCSRGAVTDAAKRAAFDDVR